MQSHCINIATLTCLRSILIYYHSYTALTEPLFPDATVSEGDLLTITCITRNIADITTFHVLDPNGIPLSTVLGVFSVPNVTRNYTGVYTCVVTSTLDNSTVNDTSVVIIECKYPFIIILLYSAVKISICVCIILQVDHEHQIYQEGTLKKTKWSM